jgi:hypothetical protein
MNQMDPTHIRLPYAFQLHFNIILSRSPDVQDLCWLYTASKKIIAMNPPRIPLVVHKEFNLHRTGCMPWGNIKSLIFLL